MVDFLVLGADLGQKDGAMLSDRRRRTTRRGHAAADSLGRRIKGRGDDRVDGAMRARTGMACIEGNLQEGWVEREFRWGGGFTGGKCEAKGDFRCQTVGQEVLVLRRDGMIGQG